jgi:hypothetical protein
LQSAPTVSFSGMLELGQWISNRSTLGSFSFLMLSRAERSKSRARRSLDQTFVVMNTSSRGTPEARSPSPTASSFPYIAAVSMWR